MISSHEHEVKFVDYCYRCKWADTAEDSYPCDECLLYPVNQDSHKPVYYKPAKEESNKT